MLASGLNGTLYVGVTFDLAGWVMQHRAGTFDGSTKRDGIARVVWYETTNTMEAAIGREKQLKRYRRDWKRNLIERDNPTWDDLASGLDLPSSMVSPGTAVDPGTRPR